MKANRCHPRWTTLHGRPVRFFLLPPASERDCPTSLRLPLLLLHGLGCSARAWEPSLRCLERQGLTQAVLAPDLPGYGHSPGPREALGMDELADWAAQFLDSQQIGQVHVAGNSMGCQVALALARQHPTRVGSLVLAGATTGAHLTPWWRSLLGLLIDGGREPWRYNLLLMRMYAQMGPRRYLETVRKMLTDDPVALAALVQAPCLIVRGERDAIVPDAEAHRLAEALPAGRFTTLPGAAHALQFNMPASFIPMTMAFLAGTEATQKSPGGATPLRLLPPHETGAVPATHPPLLSQPARRRDREREDGAGVEWLKVDGRRVRCRVLRAQPSNGSCPMEQPLLLLHGLAGSAEGWTRALRCLRRQGLAQPVVAPDMPGYGWSQGPPETWGMEELAEWTARLLDELEMPSAHIVAHSMGCQVALALAHRHPSRVGSLLLGGPTMGKQLIPPWRYLVGLLHSSREPWVYKLMALRMFAQMGVHRYVGTIRAILENDPLPGIGAVTAPALVVHGERDAIIPRAAAHELAALLPRGAFLNVVGAGHVLQFSHAAAFMQIVLAFLGGAAAQARSLAGVLPPPLGTALHESSRPTVLAAGGPHAVTRVDSCVLGTL